MDGIPKTIAKSGGKRDVSSALKPKAAELPPAGAVTRCMPKWDPVTAGTVA